ncbi:archease [Thermodesulforhabdus norvegica]|uniref:SHS2 domain-containing protein n=1 Tax=Thermodesulforhabdus norvegica TaxID=39841 RepID=A0A1I4RFC8_9BACT|nr:archease [Thermodesulforhabdus norvegica]SFM50961.1 SHS2 domain-containing protein [Thermodesulforhabdus norvegica]
MPYEYIEDWAPADQAFRAWGNAMEELFRSAVDALLGVMVSDPDLIYPEKKRNLSLREESPEFLLYQLLREIIYLKDSEHLLLRIGTDTRDLLIRQEKDGWFLDCNLLGQNLNAYRGEFLVDVKAVTLHRFSLMKTDRGWEATVVVDI